MPASLEIEMKFPVADHATLESALHAVGARPGATVDEADHYFNAPDRDFAVTDEALRLRRVGSANRVTYKGPKQDTQTKTRTEIEVPLAEGARAADDFLQLLTHLRYRPSLVVRKQRRTYHIEKGGFTVEVCLDDVAGLGAFAELEIVAPSEQLDPAKSALLALATELGLTASERRSYLQMLLEQQGSAG